MDADGVDEAMGEGALKDAQARMDALVALQNEMQELHDVGLEAETSQEADECVTKGAALVSQLQEALESLSQDVNGSVKRAEEQVLSTALEASKRVVHERIEGAVERLQAARKRAEESLQNVADAHTEAVADEMARVAKQGEACATAVEQLQALSGEAQQAQDMAPLEAVKGQVDAHVTSMESTCLNETDDAIGALQSAVGSAIEVAAAAMEEKEREAELIAYGMRYGLSHEEAEDIYEEIARLSPKPTPATDRSEETLP